MRRQGSCNDRYEYRPSAHSQSNSNAAVDNSFCIYALFLWQILQTKFGHSSLSCGLYILTFTLDIYFLLGLRQILDNAHQGTFRINTSSHFHLQCTYYQCTALHRTTVTQQNSGTCSRTIWTGVSPIETSQTA